MASVLAAHSEWEDAGLYIEIASGTKAEKRPELQRLLEECRAGRVNLILTKSISRFSRNTTDLLEMVRTLTGMGVTLIFEKEHINTSTMDTEFLLTLLASLAADESQSIASNTRWGLQRRFRDGTYRAAVAPYGYDLVDGNYKVNPIEAAVVREIFQLYLAGQSMHGIAVSLNERSIPSKRAGQVWKGKTVRGEWSNTVIRGVLTNEAYLGIMVLQKTTKDASFNTIKNRGQLPMYRISEHHEAIIDSDMFNAAQERLKAGWRPQGPKINHPFSRKLICGRCGQHFNRYTNNVNNVYWRCRSRILNASSCQQPGLLERKLEQLFMDVVATLREDYNPILARLATLHSPQIEFQKELVIINRQLVKISTELKADHISQRNQLLQRKVELETEIQSMKSAEEHQTEKLLQEINSASDCAKFDGKLFLRIIDHVIMEDDVTFHFIGGLAITREVAWPHKGERTDKEVSNADS